jgi:hypothetical protein
MGFYEDSHQMRHGLDIALPTSRAFVVKSGAAVQAQPRYGCAVRSNSPITGLKEAF